MSFLQRWLLSRHLEESLQGQKEIGFQDQDIDDVRRYALSTMEVDDNVDITPVSVHRLITDTSIPLLVVTFIASFLHLCFEFLALKSDITFWHATANTAGLSTRAIIAEFISQAVILLFLIDSEASLLIIIPSSIGLVIQAWKVSILEVSRRSTFYLVSCKVWKTYTLNQKKGLEASGENEERYQRVTTEADVLATTYLGSFLLPLLVGYNLYSLIYLKHTSWSCSFFRDILSKSNQSSLGIVGLSQPVQRVFIA